jgi:hypothetical protein
LLESAVGVDGDALDKFNQLEGRHVDQDTRALLIGRTSDLPPTGRIDQPRFADHDRLPMSRLTEVHPQATGTPSGCRPGEPRRAGKTDAAAG